MVVVAKDFYYCSQKYTIHYERTVILDCEVTIQYTTIKDCICYEAENKCYNTTRSKILAARYL